MNLILDYKPYDTDQRIVKPVKSAFIRLLVNIHPWNSNAILNLRNFFANWKKLLFVLILWTNYLKKNMNYTILDSNISIITL